MSEMTTTLTRAIFGVGNQNHDHVHRHNTLDIGALEIDRLRTEQELGGITPGTLNNIAQSAGALCTRPQGYVSLEGGFNQRRGIGMLTFLVEGNASMTSELSVIGYLEGGTHSDEGISEDTMFVPVRCFTTLTTNSFDHFGAGNIKRVIDSSHQFLMGDPFQAKDLKAVRPLDIGSEALGHAIVEQDNSMGSYSGTASSDLRNNVLMSKTNNLNTVHHSRELIRLAVNASQETSQGRGLELALADNLLGDGIGEISPTENAFFHVMQYQLGIFSMAGFSGFSIGEINSVFTNFINVLNVNLLNVSNFADDTNLLTSDSYGSASLAETIATEVAMATVHLLLSTGLTSLVFSASNNPTDFDGVSSDDAMVFIPGQTMSVFDADPGIINKVERFKQLLSQNFFSKYSGPYAHLRQIISIEVDSFLFGETTVRISFNGDHHLSKSWTNATYYLNRTSTAISGTETGLLESKNFLQNIRDHF